MIPSIPDTHDMVPPSSGYVLLVTVGEAHENGAEDVCQSRDLKVVLRGRYSAQICCVHTDCWLGLVGCKYDGVSVAC